MGDIHTSYTSLYIPDFTFTQKELAANRMGNLTPEQEQLVASIVQTRQRDARRTILWMLAFYGVLMVIGLIIEFNNQSENLIAFFQKQGILFLFITLLFLLILAVSYLYSSWIGRDARARRIRTAQGTAHVLMKEASARRTTRYMRYELRIRQGVFSKLFRFGNARSLEFFEHGKTYCVYYIDYSPFQIVLSAEKI